MLMSETIIIEHLSESVCLTIYSHLFHLRDLLLCPVWLLAVHLLCLIMPVDVLLCIHKVRNCSISSERNRTII